MDELIKLVRTYRVSSGLAERIHLAEEICRTIEPPLRLFVFSEIPRQAAEDVLQETLKAIITGLGKFAGSTNAEFWGWSHRIARNKVADYIRKHGADRLQPMPPEELWRLVEVSGEVTALSAADRLDLDHAMQMLAKAKPECYEFLRKHFILGFAYGEIAEQENLNYDNVRMKIGRCLDDARAILN